MGSTFGRIRDYESWTELSKIGIYPVKLFNGFKIGQEWQMKWVYVLREITPTVLMYPHRRGPRSRKVIKFLKGLGVLPEVK